MNLCPHCERRVRYLLAADTPRNYSLYEHGDTDHTLYLAAMLEGRWKCPYCNVVLFADPYAASRWLTGASSAP
jgi:uncharacterized Zn-finger protein